MNRYVNEPATSGKVVLHTTHGPIHAELWCKEAPLACRNFIQLCLEGYYDNQAFYRVLAGLLAQTGDPEETGEGGESVFGSPFADEFHSRLRFSHRGILAMATLRRNDNKSAVFFTLDAAPEFNAKHTIFGKVPNDTIYNLLRIGECAVDKCDRPLVLPRIVATEVLVSPFEHLVPRERRKHNEPIVAPVESAKPVFCKNLLSFEEDSEEASGVKAIHDLLEDPAFSRETVKTQQKELRRTRAPQLLRHSSSSDEDFDMKMKLRVLTEKRGLAEEALRIPELNIGKYRVRSEPHTIEVQELRDPQEEFEQLQLQLKKRPRGTNNPQTQREIKDEEAFLSPLELRRYKFHQTQVKTKGREKQTLDKLNEFLRTVHSRATDKWFSSKLRFSVDSSRAYNYKTESISSLAPHDEPARQRRAPCDDAVVTLQELFELTRDS